MKRLGMALFASAAFMVVAAPIYMKNETHPVYINGNLLGNAVMLGGNLALPLEDLARAIAGTPNLSEAGLHLRGGTLTLLPAVQKSNSSDTFTRTQMHDFHFTVKADKASPSLMTLTGPGGKSYLPLTEVAKLFGDGSFSGPTTNLHSGQAIHFTASPRGIIAVH